MSRTIRFQFDPDQPHQARAIASTVQLFEELPSYDHALYRAALEEAGQLGLQGDVVANFPQDAQLEEDWLLDNLNAVREAQREWLEEPQLIRPTMMLDMDDGELLEDVSLESHRYPVYTVEMETGTGKTYVYLRTIQELRKQYGLRKFIIVVPSRAIYEGVVKSFDDMREHFKGLYHNEVTHLIRYDSGQISQLRDFATSDKVEILLMTVDSFNRVSNNLYKATEKLQGEWKPYEYIQAVRPVLILDESQNYQSSRARQALRTLKPLFALNYSATPGRKAPNLFYRLGPMEAFQQGLVKKIEVYGVAEQYQYNDEQLSFQFVSDGKKGYGMAVETELTILHRGEPKRERLKLKKGDDLFEKTKNPRFEGLVIDELDRKNGVVVFSNGDRVNVRDHADAAQKEDIFRTQIEETVKRHMAKQRDLEKLGVKVLSLFFIDRVDNYVPEDGLIKRLFDEAFEKLKKNDPFWKKRKAEEVREGYFAKRKVRRGVEEFVDTTIEPDKKTKKDIEAEKEAYELIMKGKSRLVRMDEPVAFIFAHSALKEGWDNPNVFQICTLNQTVSEAKKRQEIGRGLRLCVDQSGARVFDEQVNVLTVVANESYDSFADALQKEYRDAGQLEPPRPSNARRTPARRNDKLFKSKAFRAFWDKLMQRAEYEIHADTEAVVEACVNRLKKEQFPEPHLVVTKGNFVLSTTRIELQAVSDVGLVKLDISISNTIGEAKSHTAWFKKGDELARTLKEPRLKGYKVVAIEGAGDVVRVHFGDKGELGLHQEHTFQVREANQTAPTTRLEAQRDHPVFNLIDRAAQETKLTRRTIRTIFERLPADRKKQIFRNPEGFSGVFIRTIRELLADHIAERVQYHLEQGRRESDLEALFPPEKKFPQKELVDGSEASMYDQVQIDSDVEKHFVELRLNEDGKVRGYLKFPSGFKIGMPRIIGDYNPDWGVLREDEKKPEVLMELVRETKGTMIEEDLQWGHEKRKLKLARKYFEALGIDYRTVDDTVPNWWEKG